MPVAYLKESEGSINLWFRLEEGVCGGPLLAPLTHIAKTDEGCAQSYRCSSRTPRRHIHHRKEHCAKEPVWTQQNSSTCAPTPQRPPFGHARESLSARHRQRSVCGALRAISNSIHPLHALSLSVEKKHSMQQNISQPCVDQVCRSGVCESSLLPPPPATQSTGRERLCCGCQERRRSSDA